MARKRRISIDTPSLFDDIDNTNQPVDAPPAKSIIDDFSSSSPTFDALDETKDTDLIINIDDDFVAESELEEAPAQDEPEATPVVEPIERIMFISFGSGSSGCCAYLGNEEEGIIIDAGIDANKVIKNMASHGIPAEAVKGIILTHDHRDHVGYAYTLAKMLNRRRKTAEQIHIHCSLHTLHGMLLRHNISIRVKDYHAPFYLETPFKIGRFEITPFAVSHDGLNDNTYGFFIVADGYSFAVATDTGCVTDGMRRYLSQAECIMVESNYDADMLATGRYPEYLKARIRGEKGHFDNADCARFVADIYSPKIRNIFLCHLSEENNTPEIARAATLKALNDKGINVGDGNNTFADREADVQLIVLPRREVSQLYIFRTN